MKEKLPELTVAATREGSWSFEIVVGLIDYSDCNRCRFVLPTILQLLQMITSFFIKKSKPKA